MALLTEYSEISQKGKFFTNGTVKVDIHIDQIFERLDELAATGDFIFRGVTEAKYKLFNSSQRFYITHELFKHTKPENVHAHYDNFISSLIDECKNWNNSTVKNQLIASGIDEDNCLAYLSYMQHFGTPTPFLDFTFDPYLSLYFATENAHYIPSNIEIENYFSIYYTYQNASAFEGWKHVFNKNSQNLKNGKISYDEVNKNSMHILLPTDEPYKILNNTNIVNQKGLFFYNNNPFNPLEETYLKYATYTKENLGEEKFKDMMMLDTFANSINIHKSFIPYVKNKLKERGITKDYVYPDTYKMKNDVLEKATISSLLTK
jgi:hypothetical protein